MYSDEVYLKEFYFELCVGSAYQQVAARLVFKVNI